MMKKITFLVFAIALLKGTCVHAQETAIITGKVLESATGEALIGATLFDTLQKKGTVSNQYGFFSLKTPTGKRCIRVSYVGFEPLFMSINIRRDTLINFQLTATSLSEVVIKNPVVLQNNVGFLNIAIADLKKIPMLLGEADLMKALSMTPGVMVGQEGSSGLYVRGSSPDQNLILLDEAPVYNTNHAFGFLSVFNPDAIKNIDLYKGGFPARYGGRAASVIDLTMKEGNNQKHNQDVSVGLINARFLAEGPLKQNRSSYMVSARQMNTFLLFLPQTIRWWAGKRVSNQTNLWLYDINAKVNYVFKDQSQLFSSVYSNYDYWRNAEQFANRKSINTLNWGNSTATVRYNKIILPQLFGKITALYSRFQHSLQNQNTNQGTDGEVENLFSVDNTIRDWGLKGALEFMPNTNYTLRVGIEQYWHRFFPGRVSVINSDQEATPQKNNSEPINTQERALYIENNLRLGSFLQVNAGLRHVVYNTIGDTYQGFEPRLGLVFSMGSHHSFKLGATQMRQFVHQLSSNGVGIPNDIWVPVTNRVAPILANQLDIGWYSALGAKRSWRFSLEAYQKQLIGLIDYPQGKDIVSDLKENWQDLIVTNVKGRVKGVEAMLQKNEGKLTGWVSFTLSKSERRSNQINSGSWYPARYDRPHSLAVVLNYALNRKWSVNTNFIYQSGYPVTLPTGTMVGLNSLPTLIYGNRNNDRMPSYHRLDIGFDYAFKTKKGRNAIWHFGAYNLYNRANPYYLEPVIATKTNAANVKQYDGISIEKRAILPILPYFSYQLKLNRP